MPDQERHLAEAETSSFLDDRIYHLSKAASDVGSAAHCQRVTQALAAATKRGLVERTRVGARRGGPWRYYVPAPSTTQ